MLLPGSSASGCCQQSTVSTSLVLLLLIGPHLILGLHDVVLQRTQGLLGLAQLPQHALLPLLSRQVLCILLLCLLPQVLHCLPAVHQLLDRGPQVGDFVQLGSKALCRCWSWWWLLWLLPAAWKAGYKCGVRMMPSDNSALCVSCCVSGCCRDRPKARMGRRLTASQALRVCVCTIALHSKTALLGKHQSRYSPADTDTQHLPGCKEASDQLLARLLLLLAQQALQVVDASFRLLCSFDHRLQAYSRKHAPGGGVGLWLSESA